MGSGWARTVFMGMDRRRFFGERGNSFGFFWMVIGIVIIVVEERCGVGVVSEGVHHHHHPSFSLQTEP